MQKRNLLSDDPWDEIKDDPRKGLFEKAMGFITQPIILPLIISVLFYIIVSNFYINFYDGLSLPFYTLNLPLTFYLNAGYNFLIFLTSFLIIPLTIIVIYISLKEFVQLKLKLIIIFLFFSLVLSLIYAISLITYFSILDIISLSIKLTFELSLLIVIIYRIKSPGIAPEYIYPYMLMFLSVFILIVYTIPNDAGYLMAENLKKGGPDNFEVQLYLKDSNISIPNNTFILISQSNGNLYLIEKNCSATEDSKLYIIPEEEIKLMTMNKNTSKYSVYVQILNLLNNFREDICTVSQNFNISEIGKI